MHTREEIDKIRQDIEAYTTEMHSLEKVKKCSDVGPFAIKYIDRHIDWLKKHIFELQTKIDLWERD